MEKQTFNGLKYMLFFMLLMTSISYVSAYQESLGTFKQFSCINLTQTCSTCTYVTLDSINTPKQLVNIGVNMTQSGSTFRYQYCDTALIGAYNYNTFSGNFTAPVSFEVTPNGFQNSISFYALILILSIGIVILGFSLKDAPITILGSLGLYFIALYILFYGLVGMKDTVYTWAIGLIILGLAMYLSIRSTYELIVD